MTNIKTEHRAAIYKLLSECYRSPDESFTGLVNDLQDALSAYYPGITELPDLAALAESVSIDELKVEHARLFLGPFKLLVPPYGSMYLDSTEQLMTDSAQDVLQWYKSEGMDVALQDMPDHIRVELEFMYFLVFREWKAGELSASANNQNGSGSSATGERTDAIVMLAGLHRKQLEFLKNHPGRWIPGFARKVTENSKVGFYRKLASITNSFIKDDISWIIEQGDIY